MLFGGKRARTINRILIVEDEPLIAFDNEHFLRDAGYEVAAAIDNVPEAVRYIGKHPLDLILADVRLSDGGTGLDVAHAAKKQGVPLVFVTGSPPDEPHDHAIGILAKPYSQRDLLATIEAVEALAAGKTPKRMPRGLTLFGDAA
jgi:CheY-like chemotaxis protein